MSQSVFERALIMTNNYLFAKSKLVLNLNTLAVELPDMEIACIGNFSVIHKMTVSVILSIFETALILYDLSTTIIESD